jgi:hypothetical protein
MLKTLLAASAAVTSRTLENIPSRFSSSCPSSSSSLSYRVSQEGR